MAKANPALTMKVVAVRWSEYRPFKNGVKGGTRTSYNRTVHQAARDGVIRIDDDGKIVEVLNHLATIDLPEGIFPEDVFSLDFLKAQLGSK